MTTPLDTRPPRAPHPTDISSDPTLNDTDAAPTTEHGDNATVDVERLAHDLARAGVDALTDDQLDLIERTAHAVGARKVLIDILLDASQPEVTRARAYGRITTKILNAAWAATPRRRWPTVLGHPPETDISSVNAGGNDQPVPPATPKGPIMTTIAKLTIATAFAALAIAVAPGVAAASGLPNSGSPNCRGQAISYGLTIAREAGNHGLGNTVGGPGLDSVQDLQQIITDFCSE